ncbi:MAG: lysophospholipid acyltransferase family protein [Anaerolineales bacterium]
MSPDLLRRVLRFLFGVLTRLEVRGLADFPQLGGCLVAVNHLSALDGPLVYCLLPRADVSALVADKHLRNPLYRWVVETVHGIWIDRENPGVESLRQARQFLKQGGVLGIAPEGTRSRYRTMTLAKMGAAYLADKSEAWIVPTAIYGTEQAVMTWLCLRRPKIVVHFGKPFRLPPLERKQRDAALLHNTDEMMCRIALLLPEVYRGAYAAHPRLRQLLGK